MPKILSFILLLAFMVSSLGLEAKSRRLLSSKERFFYDTAKYMDKKGKKLSASYFFAEYLKSNKAKNEPYKKRYQAFKYIVKNLGLAEVNRLGIDSKRYLPFVENFYQSMRKKLTVKEGPKDILAQYEKVKKKAVKHPGLLHLVASAHYLSGDLKKALSSYQECLKLKNKFVTPYYAEKFEYQTMIDQCQLGEARIFYEKREFGKAYTSYLKLPMHSIYYPSSFIEKAWTNYQMNRLDKVLGYALAFQAKGLMAFYEGEVEILASLALVRNCHWDSAFSMFKNIHRNNTQYLKANKKVQKRVSNYIDEYVASGKVKNDLEDLLVKKHFQTPYWIINRKVAVAAQKEFQQLDKSNPYYKDLNRFLSILIERRTQGLKNYLLSKLDRHTQKLKDLKLKSDMIEMEVLARMREQLYSKKSKSKELFSKISNKEFNPSFRYKWGFNGEYWQDELDNIAVPIQDRCQKREVASEKKK